MNLLRGKLRLLVMLMSAGLLIPLALYGQTVTATLTGTITDQSGAVIPGVTVKAQNQGTQLEYSAQTNETGVYKIPFIPIGTYVVSAELTGFKKAVTNPIRLEVNQTARVDLKLEIGQLSDTVSVTGVSPILQSETTEVGAVITGNTTVSLPLNGRNFAQLTLLVPGAVTPNPTTFTGATRYGGGGRPYVNGNREQGNSFLLDGVSTDETIDNRIGYSPNVDAIAEFKIETNNASAEFGNVAGAIVNTTMKSGSNEFHGNVFEFFRNDALDANTWSNNRSGAPKASLKQNVYGVTIGGPIVKNRTFFFADWQGTRAHSGGGTTASVAPAAWRTGDLSGLPQVIKDPVTGTPFPGNIIPESRIVNPAAKALFANQDLYPLPNANVSGVVGNYKTTQLTTTENDQWDLKIDHKLSSKDQLSGRFSQGWYNQTGVKGVLPTIPTGITDAPVWNFVTNWNRTIGATMVNEARFGVQRTYIQTQLNDWGGLGDANATFGIPGGQPIPGLSSITMGDGTTAIGSRATLERNAPNTFYYGDNFSMSHGKHFMKMGGQLERYQQNRFYAGNNGLLGYFNYTGLFTGSAFADFLLDQLQSKGRGSQTGTWGHRQNRTGLFFQDDWKVRSNLTLNLGMRWEYTSPLIEVHDRQSNFDLKTGQQLFAGEDGNSRALYKPYYKGFEPRVGFAWSPGAFDNKFVVRMGYGIVQFMEGTGSNLRLPMNPPFFFESDVSFVPIDGVSPGKLSTGFTELIPRDQPSGIVRIWSTDLRPQFTQQWNFSMEYQLTPTMAVTAAYVGNRATHLVDPRDFNQPLPGTGDPSTWAPLQTRRPLYATQPLITQVGGTESQATSDYNAMQLSARRRYVAGFEFLASYTLSKTITDNLGYYGSGGVAGMSAYWLNSYNRLGDRGLSFFDATHNFVWSGTYDLPWGKGKHWGGDWSGAMNAILGGWNVNNIIQLRSGFPITIQANDVSLQNSRAGGRPDRVGSGDVGDPTLEKWLDITAFKLPATGSFGNCGVSTNRAPGFINWDFGVGKQFNVTETKYIVFRAEFFNLTNTPSFSPPGRSISSPNTFGLITGTVSAPRNMEFALKFQF